MVNDNPYILCISNRYIQKLNYVFIILLLVATFVAVAKGPELIISIILGVLFLTVSLRSLQTFFFFFLFYIVTFEEPGLSVYFPGIPIKYITILAAMFFAVLILYWILGMLFRNQRHYEMQRIDTVILSFLLLVAFSGIHGLLRQYKLGNILEDIVPLGYFFAYFIVSTTELKKQYNKIFDFLLFCSFLISLQFIYALAVYKGSLFLTRIVSQHIHMAQFAIPYIGAIFLYSENRKKNLLCLFALPFIIAGVIISQQRALWFSIFLTLLIFIFLILRKYRTIIVKNFHNLVVLIIVIVLLGISLTTLIQRLSQGNIFLTVVTRASVFLSPQFLLQDESAQIRTNELKDTITENTDNFLFGKGLGDIRITQWRHTFQLTVDNSFVFLLWKMGIIGLFLFLLIYFILFRRLHYLSRMPLNNDERIVATTTFWNFIGMFIIALSNASLAHYRFIFVWTTMIALVEHIYRKYA